MKQVEKCPACETGQGKALPRVVTPQVPASENLVYLHCEVCGLVYSQQQFEGLAELDTVYDLPYRQAGLKKFLEVTRYKQQIHRYRKNWLDAALKQLGWSPAGKRALEIGSKDGSFLKLLKDDGWTAVGMDPNATFGRLARDVHGVEIREGYFEEGSFPPRSFDLIAAFHVIEHIQKPIPFLAAARNALGSDGVLFLETPNLRCIQRRQLVRSHVVLYSVQTLVQLLEHKGFEVVLTTENAPGGLLTFDQVAMLARPSEHSASDWRMGESFQEAGAFLERALRSSFPSPSRLTARNRLFRIAQSLLGKERAGALKEVYLRGQAGRRLRSFESGQGPADRSADLTRFPAPIRQAFLHGGLSEGHLQQLMRLPDEFVQLKVLARIKAFHLSQDQTGYLVDAELAQIQVSASS